MRQLALDLKGVASESNFHDLLMEAFGLPYYYGRNLDAFGDCLTDIVEPTRVEIWNPNCVPTELTRLVFEYLEMLTDYQTQSNGRFSVTFVDAESSRSSSGSSGGPSKELPPVSRQARKRAARQKNAPGS